MPSAVQTPITTRRLPRRPRSSASPTRTPPVSSAWFHARPKSREGSLLARRASRVARSDTYLLPVLNRDRIRLGPEPQHRIRRRDAVGQVRRAERERLVLFGRVRAQLGDRDRPEKDLGSRVRPRDRRVCNLVPRLCDLRIHLEPERAAPSSLGELILQIHRPSLAGFLGRERLLAVLRQKLIPDELRRASGVRHLER